MALAQPNFIFINTDQQRYDTLGCNGSTVAQTPHIDQLAAEGVRFTRCYTTNPVCMPARASWFTGQYPSHHGCWQNGVPLRADADLLQTRLATAGYHTALIGKIHLDNVWKRTEPHPLYDFDLLMECEGDPYCKDTYFQWLDRQGLFEPYMAQFAREGHRSGYVRDLPEDKHMNNWIAGHVEEYLTARRQDDQPFFLSAGFFDPHHPFDPVEPYASQFTAADMPMPIYRPGEEEGMTPPARARYDNIHAFCQDPNEIRNTIAAYHATISHVDAMVGRIMAALRETGLEENTVVVYTSDHGEMLGDHGFLWKGPLFYEPAIHVPLIYRFPEQYELCGVDESFASHTDLAPTVCELAGAAAPHLQQGQPLFDRDLNLRPQLPRPAALVEWRERPYQETGPYQIARCLVTEDWKLVYYPGQPYGELYDRRHDPDEHENRWHDPAYATVLADMRERLLQFIIDAEPCPVRTDIF
ncbi:MAG: sulfatase family protein [Armatimonadota bacterium]